MAEPLPNRAAPIFEAAALWAVREGNTDEEWEDAYALDPDRGVAALSDGASDGIFARAWAAILTRRFVEGPPDPDDASGLAAWLDAARTEWDGHFDYRALRYTQQVKVRRTGGAATLLALRIGAEAPGPNKAGAIPWRAWAVGDSCLFWVRDNRLLAMFPTLRSEDFGPTPLLLRTHADAPIPAPLGTRGDCFPGDAFVLATDAVAHWLCRGCEGDSPPDWERLGGLREDAWKRRIEELRQNEQIVNDDCTLLFLRIQGSPGRFAGADDSRA